MPFVFFQTPAALSDFKKGNFALAAQVSAVAASSGASANAKYSGGVAVFTVAKGSLRPARSFPTSPARRV